MAALATENFELGRRIQLLDQQVAEITQSITISYPAPEVPQTEDLLFFKNKLLEAENYIFRIEKEKEAGR